MQSIHEILFQYWHFRSFRPQQEDIIQTVLQRKDVLALLPTGGGKSLCYQIPGLALPGVCLVITPLIALMKDQVANLTEKNIPAIAIHGGIHQNDLEDIFIAIKEGAYKFVYLSPERLKSELLLEYLPSWKVNLVAVDEAHCVSLWGYDFRPAYLDIADIKSYLSDTPFLALTATATPIVQQDILQRLSIPNATRFFTSFKRANIAHHVMETELKLHTTIQLLNTLKGSGLIYCRNRRTTQEIAEALQAQGIDADFFHAGIAPHEKDVKQEKWITGNLLTMVCTNAFGMGIDKANVRYVIHYDIPDSPEALYQEAGRAGRDGQPAQHFLLYRNLDLEKMKGQLDIKFPPSSFIQKVYVSVCHYLEVGFGYGEEEWYDFDLADFCKKFEFPSLETYNAIKILEQHQFWQFTDALYTASEAMILLGREELFEIEKSEPEQDEILKSLLRTYPGISNYYCNINEFDLAQRVQVGHDYIKHKLSLLHQKGYIEYRPQKNIPRLLFQHNRLPDRLFALNEKLIAQLKNWYKLRIEAMIALANNRKICRTKMLLQYFEEIIQEDCGICDICKSGNKKTLDDVFLPCKNTILQALKKKSTLTIKECLMENSTLEEEMVIQTIRIMADEKIIELNKQGDLIRKR